MQFARHFFGNISAGNFYPLMLGSYITIQTLKLQLITKPTSSIRMPMML
jgi:hypothetical protein